MVAVSLTLLNRSIWALFLVIISTAVPGGSLFVNLLANPEIVCLDDETVSYECTVTTLQVQWIVEPVILASGSNPVIFSNVPSSVGLTISRAGIIVEHVSNDPLLTRLTINSSVIDSSVNVTCSTVGLTPPETDTLRYFPVNESPLEPVSNMTVTGIVNGFTDGSILVQFVRSPSPGITHYIINCTDSSCKQTMIDGMEDDAVVEASSSCEGSAHTVSVYAVNRCGRESQPVSKEVEIKTSPAFCAFVALFPIMAVTLIVVIALSVLIGCYIYKKALSQKFDGKKPDGTASFNKDGGVKIEE